MATALRIDDAEREANSMGWRMPATVARRARVDVVLDHLGKSITVDVVRADDDDVVRVLVINDVQRLVDRVPRSRGTSGVRDAAGRGPGAMKLPRSGEV